MSRDRRIATALERWFAASARDLPWRAIDPGTGRRDPYRSLVSEAMLQQTQVSRVLEKFESFMDRFPTLGSLARAREQSVLAAWSGLGYYRRARNLHRAAKMIMEEFAGDVPRDVESLRRLPGVGRYTAGAIASMVYGDPEPLVDGNVQRVLVRVEGRDIEEPARARKAWTWDRATSLVRAAEHPGVLNEALMELGATVCVPAPGAPRCGECPLARSCVAKREGSQDRLPKPTRSAAKRDLFHSVVVVRSHGRVLMEQRPEKGLWASMWQAVTIEREDRAATRQELIATLRLNRAIRQKAFEHQTSHRRVCFEVWEGSLAHQTPMRGEWVIAARLNRLSMGNAQRRALSIDESPAQRRG